MVYKITSVFIILVFSVYVNSGMFSYFLFKANQEVIISDCCEKKVINCEGKCYLMKSIEKNDKASSGEKDNLKENVNLVLYCHLIKNDLKINNNLKPLFQNYVFYTLEGHSILKDNPPKI